MAINNKTPSETPKQTGGGFLQHIFSIFANGDPEAEKKKLIKTIGKDLSHSRYKFYKPKGSEALPGLGRFFYEIYKIVAPAQVLLTNAASSGVLKSFVIDNFLSKEQLEISERLTDAWIQEKAKSMSIKDLSEVVKQDMIRFFSVFDGDLTTRIDSAHTTLVALANFINFDYFFLLKKFDSGITERNFVYHPKFETISADYIVDDIKDFLEVFLALNMEADWKRILGALKEYRNIDILPVDTWIKLVAALVGVRDSHILEQIVRHAHKDPYWTAAPRAAVQ